MLKYFLNWFSEYRANIRFATVNLKWKIHRWWDINTRFIVRIYYTGLYKRWKEQPIPKDEFDETLRMNGNFLMYLSETDAKEYVKVLVRKRTLAHERDL